VHHHLIKQGLRTSVGLVVETGEAHEVHQFCVLAGYGAEAINPYLAFDTLEQLLPELDEKLTLKEAQKRYIKAVDKGMLKVMAKMGISTYQSYCGRADLRRRRAQVELRAQVFHRHAHPSGRRRPASGRARDGRAPPPGLRRRADPGERARCRRRVRLPHPRRGARVAPVGGGRPAARGARNLPDKYRAYAQQITTSPSS